METRESTSESEEQVVLSGRVPPLRGKTYSGVKMDSAHAQEHSCPVPKSMPNPTKLSFRLEHLPPHWVLRSHFLCHRNLKGRRGSDTNHSSRSTFFGSFLGNSQKVNTNYQTTSAKSSHSRLICWKTSFLKPLTCFCPTKPWIISESLHHDSIWLSTTFFKPISLFLGKQQSWRRRREWQDGCMGQSQISVPRFIHINCEARVWFPERSYWGLCSTKTLFNLFYQHNQFFHDKDMSIFTAPCHFQYSKRAELPLSLEYGRTRIWHYISVW